MEGGDGLPGGGQVDRQEIEERLKGIRAQAARQNAPPTHQQQPPPVPGARTQWAQRRQPVQPRQAALHGPPVPVPPPAGLLRRASTAGSASALEQNQQAHANIAALKASLAAQPIPAGAAVPRAEHVAAGSSAAAARGEAVRGEHRARLAPEAQRRGAAERASSNAPAEAAGHASSLYSLRQQVAEARAERRSARNLAERAGAAVASERMRFKLLEAEFQAAKKQHAETCNELTATRQHADGLEEQLRNAQGEPADASKQVEELKNQLAQQTRRAEEAETSLGSARQAVEELDLANAQLAHALKAVADSTPQPLQGGRAPHVAIIGGTTVNMRAMRAMLEQDIAALGGVVVAPTDPACAILLVVPDWATDADLVHQPGKSVVGLEWLMASKRRGEWVDTEAYPHTYPGPMELPASSVRSLEGHTGEVFSVAWRPASSNILASSSGDSTARIWDASPASAAGRSTPAAVCCHAGHGTGGDQQGVGDITALDWCPDGSCLATGTVSGNLFVWNHDGTLRGMSEGQSDPLLCMRFNPKGDLLLSGGAGGTVIVHRADPGSGQMQVQHKHKAATAMLDLDWQDDTVFAACFADHTIAVCHVGSTSVHRWRAHDEDINSIRWCPRGEVLASCSSDETIKIWRYASHGREELVCTLTGHGAAVYTVRWGTPQAGDFGGRLVLASGSFDCTVKLWDAEGGTCLQTLLGHKADIYDVAWSPSCSYLATASSDSEVLVWCTRTGKMARVFRGAGGRIYELEWNAGGDLLAACFQGNQLLVAELCK